MNFPILTAVPKAFGDALARLFSGLSYVQSGGAITAQGAGTLQVNVAAGTVFVNGVTVVYAGGNVIPGAAPVPPNNRIDIIRFASGAVVPSVLAGVAAPIPVEAALPAGDLYLGQVFIPGNANDYTTGGFVGDYTVPGILMPTSPNLHGFHWEPLGTGGINVISVGSGNTQANLGGRGIALNTGVTNPSSNSQRVILESSGAIVSQVSRARRMELQAYLADTLANANSYLYLTEEQVDVAPSAIARHLGVKNLNGVVSFTTADGATEQTTNISAFITGATMTMFIITFDGTTARCYINGVLRATHATNVPGAAGVSATFRAFIDNNATANARVMWFTCVDVLMANS